MSNYPENFISQNYAGSKKPNVVFEIIGLTEKYTFGPAISAILYGNNYIYGGGNTYGQLTTTPEFKPYLSDQSNFTISQRIEPEQGRGNTGDMTIVLVDKDETGSRLISPGVTLDEILGKECRVWLGYQSQEYPDDYFVIFQGYITNVISQAGMIRLAISDATQKKRQGTFFSYKSYQFLPMTSNQSFVNAASIQNLPYGFLNINGQFDPMVGIYLKIGNEYALLSQDWNFSYEPNYRKVPIFARGQRGTTAVSHNAITVQATAGVQRYLDVICNGLTFSALVGNGDYFIGEYSQAPTANNFCRVLQDSLQTSFAASGGSGVTFRVAINLNSTYYFEDGNPNRWKFIIQAIGASDFQLRFLSGANNGNNLQDILGFDNLNYSGATSYLSPNWVETGADDITSAVSISGHPLDVALTVMLSGWGGPFISDQLALGVGYNGVSADSYAICLPAGIDAIRDYGLTAGIYSPLDVTLSGDEVRITGSSIPANNVNCIITGIEDGPDNQNQVLRVYVPSAGTLAQDTGSSIRLAFRSKYDRLPYGYGLKMVPKFIDVAAHEYVKTVYLSDAGYQIFPLLNNQQPGKEFIESQCYLPFGCYGVTKFGKLSLSLTRPPIAQQSPVQIDKTNILNPQSITVTRGLNNRRFFNLIQYQYDKDDAGKYFSVYRALDTDSLNTIGQTTILPINSDGIQTTYNNTLTGSPAVVTSVANRFLARYSDAAFEIKLQVNMEAGARIEAGDIVKLVDDGSLGITNLDTGERNLGTNLFEVIDRSLDIKSGVCSLTLLSNVGFLSSDRFGGIAPSTKVDDFFTLDPNTSSSFSLSPSYGAIFGSNEYQKWVDYIGQDIVVHASDWSYSSVSTVSQVLSASATNPYGRIIVDPPLSFVPVGGDIVSIADYSTSTVSTEQEYVKAVHSFLDPSVDVATGVSATEFTVALGDVSKFFVGSILYIHDDDYTNRSPNVSVLSINAGTGTIIVDASLGFTPTVGMTVELIGFPDQGQGYMFS